MSRLIGVTRAPLSSLPPKLRSPMGRRNLKKFTKFVVPSDYLLHKPKASRVVSEPDEITSGPSTHMIQDKFSCEAGQGLVGPLKHNSLKR